MKHILLLGDSISQNYQDYVREHMKDIADVRYPNDNGRFGTFTLRYVYEWIKALSQDGISFDIVHFNVGLWDVLRLASEDRTFTSEQEYADVLIRICQRIKKYCPKSKIIFALSTKVIEPGFTPGADIGIRKNEDIERFNQIAIDVFSNTEVIINDLWTVSEGMNECAHSDCVHYETEEGIEILGESVVEVLKRYL